MSLELCHRSATDLAAVRADELSPVDLVRAHLDRIEALGDRTNAFVTVLEESAMERAREAETAVEAGEDPRPLHGVPVAIKDLAFHKAGVPHTRGMKPLAGNVAEEDSVGVERIEAAGGIVVGTTNTPEMGHTPRTYNELAGPTGTPFDPSYNAGAPPGGRRRRSPRDSARSQPGRTWAGRSGCRPPAVASRASSRRSGCSPARAGRTPSGATPRSRSSGRWPAPSTTSGSSSTCSPAATTATRSASPSGRPTPVSRPPIQGA